MLKRISQFIGSNQLATTSDTILVGVSGGMDSMALSYILHHLGYKTAIAHVNYRLRGKESDDDERFVRQWAKKNKIEFFSASFDTIKIAESEGSSIQMAARDLRYNYFNELMKEKGYDKLAVAHHIDDSIETVIFNLVKGTGIKGVGGILPKRGHLIRPLLCCTHADIKAFMMKNQVNWREDSSNNKTDYSRNFIRHKIMPLLSELNTSLRDTFHSTSLRLRESAQLQEWIIDNIRENHITQNRDGSTKLDLSWREEYPIFTTLLHELLKPFSVTFEMTVQIAASIQHSGAKFKNADYLFYIDREAILIEKNTIENESEVLRIENDEYSLIKLSDNEELEISVKDGHHISFSEEKGTFDRSKMKFPLFVRSWIEGDKFKPLGMKGFKKVSDYFIDQKIPVPEKSKIKILFSGDDIVWVIGHRVDDRFKVTDSTQETLEIIYKTK